MSQVLFIAELVIDSSPLLCMTISRLLKNPEGATVQSACFVPTGTSILWPVLPSTRDGLELPAAPSAITTQKKKKERKKMMQDIFKLFVLLRHGNSWICRGSGT